MHHARKPFLSRFSAVLTGIALVMASSWSTWAAPGLFSVNLEGGEDSLWWGIEEGSPAGIEDASLGPNEELSDAYDGFWEFYVEGAEYAPTSGLQVTWSGIGAIVVMGPYETNGILMRQKFVTYSNVAVLGTLFTVKNMGTASTTITVEVNGNLGSDSISSNVMTFSGDAIFDTNDQWLVTAGDNSDPRNGFAYFGPGAPVKPVDVFMQNSNDDVSVFFDLTLAPGEAKSLLCYSQLSTSEVAAVERIALFENTAQMQDTALFSGLNAVDIETIVNWVLPAYKSPGDFDGDGVSDQVVASLPGYYWYFLNSGAGFALQQFGYEGTTPVTGDFDGDGRLDPGVYDPASGMWYVLKSSEGFGSFQFGFGGTIPVPADYDGDGMADPAVFDPASATWYLMRTTEGFVSLEQGAIRGTPVPADFDGNGQADLATFNPRNGEWSVFFTGVNTTGGGIFGARGMTPVPGDYDGDGADDPAVYDPAAGVWYISGSTAGFWSQEFGAAGLIPVPGDYDSDKTADFGVYDPETLTWYTLGNSGAFATELFGVPDGIPVGGKE
jgi:hypothetical protein